MDIKVISPFPFQALPRVWKWIEQFRAKVTDDFSPKTLPDFMESMAATWERQNSWAVTVDGELGGLITFERLSPWLGTAHCMFKTDFQGRGISLKACRIAVAAMFETGIGKLMFSPLAGNLAIGSLVCNLGAKREGTLIGQTLQDGKPADILIYGLTKDNFNASSNNPIHSGDRRGDQFCRRVVPVGKTEGNDHQQHIEHNADIQCDGKRDERGAIKPVESTPDGPESGNGSDKP